MKTNRAGIDLIKRFEGLRLKAYRDPVGIWTIGYGHTSAAGPPEVKPGMAISAEQAHDILAADLNRFELEVVKAIDKPVTDNQFAALVSLCYNIGPGNFRRSSAVRYFNARNTAKAANAILLWNKAGGRVLEGLKRRRAAEMALFLTPKATGKPAEAPPPVMAIATPATPGLPAGQARVEPVAPPEACLRLTFWQWLRSLVSAA